MKQFTGTVTSTKMQNTAIVKVINRSMHPTYKKIVSKTKNFACDMNGVEVAEGNTVLIQETRPLSKTKRFKVVEVIK